MQTQIWPHWLLTNSAPHGGRHALLACSAEAAAALFAMDKLLTRRPDNYPDTGGLRTTVYKVLILTIVLCHETAPFVVPAIPLLF